MNFANNTRIIFESMFKYKRKLKLLYESGIQNRNVQRNQTKNIDILFFGTDKFSLPSLRALVGEQKRNRTLRKVAVVTSFKSASNPVKKYASAENLDCFDWPISNDAIMNGDSKTGVTIMRILPKHFDIGEILAQKEVEISKDCLMPELHDTLSKEGAQLLVDCLHDIDNRLENAQQQNPEHITYAPKVTAVLAQVDWKSSAVDVYNLFRALYSFKPLTTKWNNVQLRLIDVKCSTVDVAVSPKPPGTIEYSKVDKCLKVICGNGSSVCVYKLGIEGKKVMSAAEFYNGFLSKSIDKSYFV